jgi:hypothetical protein
MISNIINKSNVIEVPTLTTRILQELTSRIYLNLLMSISSIIKLKNLILWRNIETKKQLPRIKVKEALHRVHT